MTIINNRNFTGSNITISDKIEFGPDPEITKARSKALQLITEFQRDKSVAKASTYYPKIKKDSVADDLKALISAHPETRFFEK